MTPVTVTGTRPSEDFTPPPASINRLGGEIRDIPQSIVIINKALMQSQGATSFQSAIRNTPGLTLGAAEGGNDRQQHQPQRLLGPYRHLPRRHARPRPVLSRHFALEQIEILMGPSSMLFGRGSTGGVINQVLKKPSLQQGDGRLGGR